MLVLEDMVSTDAQHRPVPTPDAGVIDDARSRQRRERLGIAAFVLAMLAAAAVYSLAGGGGNGNDRWSAGVSRSDASSITGASVRLTHGRTSWVITVKAPADHAYDVKLRARPAAALLLNFGFPGPPFSTLADKQLCDMTAASTSCTLHFAAGGNQGGTWKWKLTKTSAPATRIHIRVVFAPQAGDHPD